MVTTGTNVPLSSNPPPALPLPASTSGGPAQILSGNPQTVLANRGYPVSAASGPTISAPAPAHDNTGLITFLSILATLGAITTASLTYLHLKLRRDQAYAQLRAGGLTLEADIKRMEERLSKSAGDRDHWHREFLTDLGKVARNGLLRPAKCRTEDIIDLMKLRKRNLPVISTVVAPSGAGKSRMVEGLVYSLYHDLDGRHFSDVNYNAGNRLFSDIDPTNLLCYRINLGQLTHADAEPMFHYLMQKADQCVKQGGRCLVIIDDVHFLYGPNGHASAARLIHLIDGWTDGQMKDNKGLWGVAMAPLQRYEDLIETVPSRQRRFERYDMPVLAGGRLRAVVDETLAEWEGRLKISIPETVRDRAMELMHHPKNKMANPYAILNLLDRVSGDMAVGETMTRDALNRSFARLHRLSYPEVAQWGLYADVERSIHEELTARFGFLNEMAPQLIPAMAKNILKDWKNGNQTLLAAEGEKLRQLPESFIENGIAQVYDAISRSPINLQANTLMRAMRERDAGGRHIRNSNGVKRLPVAAPSPRAANG